MAKRKFKPNDAAPPYEPEAWNSTLTTVDVLGLYDRYTDIFEAFFSMDSAAQQEVAMLSMFSGTKWQLRNWAPQERGNFVQEYAHALTLPNYDVRRFSRMHKLPIGKVRKAREEIRQFLLEKQRYQLHTACYDYLIDSRRMEYPATWYTRSPGGADYKVAAQDDMVHYAPTDPEYRRRWMAHTIEGMRRDGVSFVGPNPVLLDKNAYLGAMYVAVKDTGFDFHFVRQNPDGTFSHKHGFMPVTNKDFKEKLITNPAKASFGDYQFVGYINVPKGGVRNILAETNIQPNRRHYAGNPMSFFFKYRDFGRT